VVVESAVIDGVVTILTMRIRCTDDTGYRFVDHGQHEAVAETLGIMEALGQKAPPPATEASDAHHYQQILGHLGVHKQLFLIVDSGKVLIADAGMGELSRGVTLADALDHLRL
jgi:hypothetical protein